MNASLIASEKSKRTRAGCSMEDISIWHRIFEWLAPETETHTASRTQNGDGDKDANSKHEAAPPAGTARHQKEIVTDGRRKGVVRLRLGLDDVVPNGGAVKDTLKQTEESNTYAANMTDGKYIFYTPKADARQNVTRFVLWCLPK